MKWEVQIAGDIGDLTELTRVFGSNKEFRVFEKNGNYFIESKRFEGLTTSDEAGSLADAILKSLTGAIRVTLQGSPQLRILNVARVLENGSKMVHVTVHDEGYGRDNEYIADGTSIITSLDKILEWLPLILDKPNVQRALRIFGKDHDWSDLLHIFEIIQDDVGGKIEWVSKTSIKRFKRTANSLTATGDTSRHGKEKTVPPPHPMDIREASEFIRKILSDWLCWKAKGARS